MRRVILPAKSLSDCSCSCIATLRKPAVVCCVGEAPRESGRTVGVDTLGQAGDAAVAVLTGRRWQPRRFGDAARVAARMAEADVPSFAGRRILGLYTGGTLAYETSHLFGASLGAGHSHRILDLGDDEYTVGRPHPMIHPSVRNDLIGRAGRDAGVGIVLLDLVLGQGAHANPAESLATAVGEARRAAAADGRNLAFLGSIVGTRRDPQGLAAQQATLERAGCRRRGCGASSARAVHPLQRQAAFEPCRELLPHLRSERYHDPLRQLRRGHGAGLAVLRQLRP